MPTISINVKRIEKYLGRKITKEKLIETLPWIGISIEEVNDEIKVEYNPNRPDFSTHAGIARALKGFLEIELGAPSYTVKKGNIKIIAKNVPKRPIIRGLVARNLELDEESLIELIHMQESLHWALGRDRRKASIGFHDLDKVKPPFIYTIKPPTFAFVPLNESREWTLKEILEKHPKGRQYGKYVTMNSLPILMDSEGNVMAFPPIINSSVTTVTPETRNLFIDVTGTHLKNVIDTVNIIATTLIDMGASIESVDINGTLSPDLTPEKWKLKSSYINKMIGLSLSDEDIVKALEKCRISAKILRKGLIEAIVPSYRIDLLHPIDFAEEVAIGYGYYNLKPSLPNIFTIGSRNKYFELASKVRKIMLGLGYQEVFTTTLSNKKLFSLFSIETYVDLINPLSEEYDTLRSMLLPHIIYILSLNTHEEYPQKIFEVGDVVVPGENETRYERHLHVAAAIASSKVTINDIRSDLEGFLKTLGIEYKFESYRYPHFFLDRSLKIITPHGEGRVGEIHPEILEKMKIHVPVAAFEVELAKYAPNL